MFDLSFEKIAVIGLLALVLVGPDRLPGYAAQLAKWVRVIRGMADDAKSRVAAEMGPEFEDVDWQKLDPRRYHPRRMLQDAWNGTGDDAAAERRSEQADEWHEAAPSADEQHEAASVADGHEAAPDGGYDAGPAEPGILQLFAEHEAEQRRLREAGESSGVAA